jgi:hypothetical protein
MTRAFCFKLHNAALGLALNLLTVESVLKFVGHLHFPSFFVRGSHRRLLFRCTPPPSWIPVFLVLLFTSHPLQVHKSFLRLRPLPPKGCRDPWSIFLGFTQGTLSSFVTSFQSTLHICVVVASLLCSVWTHVITHPCKLFFQDFTLCCVVKVNWKYLFLTNRLNHLHFWNTCFFPCPNMFSAFYFG